MDKKQNVEEEVKATRPRGSNSGEALDKLRVQETFNHMQAEKEFGQQNDNNSLT